MTAVAGHSVNGTQSPSTINVDKDILEYEKILKLKDEIFAGSHPRLKVPAHAIRKVATNPLKESFPSPAIIPLPPKPVIEQPVVTLPGLQLNTVPEKALSQPPPPVSTPARNGLSSLPKPPPVPTTTASGIDPIFLTKSDDLVRAENQLSRQRLEKQLREQFEQKKIDARRKPHPEEVKPELNPAAVLAKVMETAKPVPTVNQSSLTTERVSPGDSFDENSFYSSKAPDSTPEEGALSESPPVPEHQVQSKLMDDLDADGLAERRTTQLHQVDELDSPYKIVPRPEYNVQADTRPIHLSQLGRPQQQQHAIDLTAMDVDDDDEDDYEPPEPTDTYTSNGNDRTYDSRDPRGRPLRRYSGTEQNGKRYDSPLESDMRIVRNHITSPVAPQPFRVSPLAVTKDATLSQNPRSRRDRMRHQDGRPVSLRASPDYSINPSNQYQQAQNIPSRKKRKLDKKEKASNRRASGRNAAVSPEPYIKDEPVSPPPFHEIQPLGSARSRITSANRPALVEDSPVQVRYVPAPDAYAGTPARQIIYEEIPMPRSEPRPYSRSGLRPLGREDQDLRKVASMHNMRLEQSGEYVDQLYATPARTRAPSYAVMEPPPRIDEPRYYPEPSQPYERPVPREERVIHSPAPLHRELEPENRYQAIAPSPQQTRIIVDRYGNRFYEIVDAPRASVAPRPSRPVEVEPYNNTAYASNRAASAYAEPLPEKRYVSEMPPPQISYRRIADVPRTPVAEARSTFREPLEPSRIARASSVQVVDYSQRQPVYVDEREMREPSRTASTRPVTSRYGELQPGEVVQPLQSVRPVGREGTVFIDDRQPVRREYLPAPNEQPMYRRVVDAPQYYEVQDRGNLVADIDEPQRRLVPRYQ